MITDYRRELSFYSDPSFIAEGFLTDFCHSAGVYLLRYWRDEFYLWDGGRYVRLPETELRSHIAAHVQRMNETSSGTDEPRVKLTVGLVNNILTSVKARTLLGFRIEANSWLDESFVGTAIVFNNGIVRLSDLLHSQPVEAGKHTPLYFGFVKLPYSYRPQAKCPLWEEFLAEVMESDAERISLLQQWAGYLLSGALRQHKFMLLAGEGSNGKTTFAGIIERMLGLENVSHVCLSEFGRRFGLSSTLGKLLNSTSESSHRLDEHAETVLKSYTSGDRMTFERKFRAPVEAAPTAKVMISTNQLPAFSDRTSGLWRRMLYVPFERTYTADSQDKSLALRLSTELSGIFNWAVEGARWLDKYDRFIEPKKCSRAIARYRRDTNPARSFLEGNYTYDLGFDGVGCGDIYQTYRRWCELNGYRPLNSNNFGKEVKRVFGKVERKYIKYSGKRTWCYMYLAVKEDSEIRNYDFDESGTDGAKGAKSFLL